MDASFQETMQRGAVGWRGELAGTHSTNLQREPSARSAASYGSTGAGGGAYEGYYGQQPLAVASQQPNYYQYEAGPAPTFAPAQEYWTAAPPMPPMAQYGAQASMAQTQQYGAQQQQPQQKDYLSNYTSPTPAPEAEARMVEVGMGSPVSPTAMPNPFDGGVLKVTNE